MPKSGEHRVNQIDSFFRVRPSSQNIREGENISFLEDGKLIKQEKRNGVVYEQIYVEQNTSEKQRSAAATGDVTNLIVQSSSSGGGDITGITAGTGLTGGGSSGNITLNIDSTVTTLTGTQTLTNKTLASPTFTGDINFTDASTPVFNVTDTTNTVTTKIQSANSSGLVGTSTDHNFNVIRNNVSYILLQDGTIMINNPGNDVDVNIKDSSANSLFRTDAGNSRVGILDATPSYTLDVNGTGRFTGAVQLDDNLTVTGDLQVNGTTTTVNQTNLDVSDNIIGLNRGVSNNTNDSGLIIERGSAGDNAAILWDETASKFTLGTTTATPSATGNLTIAAGTLVASLEGNVTGDVTGSLSNGTITSLTSPIALSEGGTGGGSASEARTSLGLVIGTNVQAYDAGLASIAGLTTAADKMIYTTASDTYAVTALTSTARTLLDDTSTSAMRTTLGVDAAGTDNSTPVTLAGTRNYITAGGTDNQTLTLGQIDISDDTNLAAVTNGGIALSGDSLKIDGTNIAGVATANNTSDTILGFDTDDTSVPYTYTIAEINALGPQGTVTNVVTENGITGGPFTTTGTLGLDFSTLTDMTGDISGTTEFILQNGTTESRKAASEIKLSYFNNDSNWTSNAGTVTSITVTGGNGLTGGGSAITSSGTVTLNVGEGTGIDVTANAISLDVSDVPALPQNIVTGDNFLVYNSTDGTALATVSELQSALSIPSISGTNDGVVTKNPNDTLTAEANLTFDSSNVLTATDGSESMAYTPSNNYLTIHETGATKGSHLRLATDNSDFIFTAGGSANQLSIYDVNLAANVLVVGSTGNFTIPNALSVTSSITTNYGVAFTNGNTNFLLYNNTGDDLIYLRDTTNSQMLQTWTTTSSTIHKNLVVDGGLLTVDDGGDANEGGEIVINPGTSHSAVWRIDSFYGHLRFFSSTTSGEQMALTSDGNLSILTGTKFSLDGRGGHTYIQEESDGNIVFYADNRQMLRLHEGNGEVVINDPGVDTNFRVEGDTDSNLLFVDAGTDRVGIGTASPQQKLQVDGNIYLGPNNSNNAIHSGANIALMADGEVKIVADANDTSGVGVSDIVFGYGTSTNTDSNRDFTIAELGTHPRVEIMRIDSSTDRVGIGTSSPGHKLDVNGNINTTGAYYMDDSEIIDTNKRLKNLTSSVGTDRSGGSHIVDFATPATPGSTGWYTICKASSANGRGGGIINISTTGGSITPVTITIDFFVDWSGNLNRCNTQGVSGQFTKVRLIETASTTELQIYVNTTVAQNVYVSFEQDRYNPNYSLLDPWATATPTVTGHEILLRNTSVYANTSNTSAFVVSDNARRLLLGRDSIKSTDLSGSTTQLFINSNTTFSGTVTTGGQIAINDTNAVIYRNSNDLELITYAGYDINLNPAGDVHIDGASLYIPVGERLYFGGGNHTYISEDTDDRLRFFTGGAEFMRFTEAGTDQINLYHNTYITGTMYASSDVVAFNTSDKRLKDNLKPISNSLEKLQKLTGYEFDWNDNQDTYKGHDVGVIAQEVEEVLPEVVTTRDSGYKAVKYEKIVPLLIEAIKEQQQQIEELKNG